MSDTTLSSAFSPGIDFDAIRARQFNTSAIANTPLNGNGIAGNAIGGGDAAARNAKIDAAAQDFEAVFLAQMMEHMFSTLEVNPLFGGGEGEETFRSLLVDEYGKLMARAGGIGIADHVKRELLRLQEVGGYA